MKRIENFERKARNISDTGTLTYCLWVDDEYSLHVQIIANTEGGTFPMHIFSVEKYKRDHHASGRVNQVEGRTQDNPSPIISNDNNTLRFIEAVMKDILQLDQI